MIRKCLWLLAVAILTLAGCGRANETDDPKAKTPEKPPQETAFDDLTATQKRAKDTEQAVQQSKERIDAAVEESETKREHP